MWVDARSRVAYEEFGDVVCFNATYITNKYELPFANFVGVNHHGQSILLGCALVLHEDSDTFAWVLRKWLSCMRDKQPGAILTDQAAAMRKPLAEVMPNSRHRWCIWHILKKFPDKLGNCEYYADFKSPLKTLIYESFTVAEFERRWGELMTTYKLEENEWLSELYDERHMWVPAFMKEHFWVGMKTTQRVESINSFFDEFVNRKTRLYEFPEKYTRAMARRVKLRMRQMLGVANIVDILEERDLGGNIIQYLLEDRVWIIPEGKSEEEITDRRRFYSVLFNTVTKDVSCDCRKFETFGILCRHVIQVYDQNLVFDIPSKYVLRRWRKDVSRKHTRVKVAYHDPTENVVVQTYNNLMAKFLPICDVASSVQDKATIDLVVQSLQKLSLEVQASRDKFLASQPCLPTLPRNLLPSSEIGSNIPQAIDTPESVSKPVVEEGNTNLQTAVKDPISRKKPRGRPKGSRHKSLAETGYKKSTGKKGKNIAGTQMHDPAVQQPTAVKLPAKRKRTQVLQQHNTIENYYDFVEDAVVGDDILMRMRNGLGWSGPSDTF